MMKAGTDMDTYQFGRRELLTLGTIVVLAPALRLFITESAEYAGRGAWLTALCALPVLLLYARFLSELMEQRQEGESLQGLLLRLLGPVLGRAGLAVAAAWLLLYAGFVLRSGSDRLVVTIYPNTSPAGFSVVMGLIALIAALGSVRSTARVARIVQPVVLGALFLILFFALFSVKLSNLLPLTVDDVVPILKGSVAAVDVISLGAYALCFLEGRTPKAPGRFKANALWMIALTVLLTALNATIIGSFGAEVTSLLSRPFFVLVRNLVFFNSVERVEALLVMLWTFPDFLLVSAFFTAAQHSVRLLLGLDEKYSGQRLLDFKNGRFVIWLCAVAAILCAIFIAPDTESLSFWSTRLIPAVNMSFAFLFLPAVYVIGKLRKVI